MVQRQQKIGPESGVLTYPMGGHQAGHCHAVVLKISLKCVWWPCSVRTDPPENLERSSKSVAGLKGRNNEGRGEERGRKVEK